MTFFVPSEDFRTLGDLIGMITSNDKYPVGDIPSSYLPLTYGKGDVINIYLEYGTHVLDVDLCTQASVNIFPCRQTNLDISYTNDLGSFPDDLFDCERFDNGPYDINFCWDTISVSSSKRSPTFECLERGRKISWYSAERDSLLEFCVENVCESSIRVTSSCSHLAAKGDTLVINPLVELVLSDGHRLHADSLHLEGLTITTDGSGMKNVYVSANNLSLSTVFLKGSTFHLSSSNMTLLRPSAVFDSVVSVENGSSGMFSYFTMFGSSSSLNITETSSISLLSNIFIMCSDAVGCHEVATCLLKSTQIYGANIGLSLSSSSVVLSDLTILNSKVAIASVGSTIVVSERGGFSVMDSDLGIFLSSGTYLVVEGQVQMTNVTTTDSNPDGTATVSTTTKITSDNVTGCGQQVGQNITGPSNSPFPQCSTLGGCQMPIIRGSGSTLNGSLLNGSNMLPPTTSTITTNMLSGGGNLLPPTNRTTITTSPNRGCGCNN